LFNLEFPDMLFSIWNPSPEWAACHEHHTVTKARQHAVFEVIFLSEMLDFRYDIYIHYIPENELYDMSIPIEANGRRRLSENFMTMNMDGFSTLVSKDCLSRCIGVYKPGPKIVGMSAEIGGNHTKVGMPLTCRMVGHNACLPHCEKFGDCDFADAFARPDWWATY